MIHHAELLRLDDGARRRAIAAALARAPNDVARLAVAAEVRAAGLDPVALFPDHFSLFAAPTLSRGAPVAVHDGRAADATPTGAYVAEQLKHTAKPSRSALTRVELSPAAQTLATCDPALRRFDPSRRPERFDAAVEFPNLFAPVAAGASDEELAARRELLEKALANLLRHVEIPVPDGEGAFSTAKLFDRLPPELIRDDAGAPHLMASGGVVRAAIAYLYRQMLIGMQRVPQVAPEATLARLATSTAPVPSHHVRGVNSDWDLLLDCPAETAPVWIRRVERAVQQAFDAAGGHAGLTLGAHFERSMFLVADVKEYGPQIERTIKQGGSELDWLAFDVVRGTFVEPKQAPGIVDRLLAGTFRFQPPTNASAMADPLDTVLRALRPFLELPFVQLADATALNESVERAEGMLTGGGVASERAVSQIVKALANAVDGGAHNRVLRTDDPALQRLARVAQLAAKSRNQQGIQRCVDTWPIPPPDEDATSGRALNGLPPEFLMSPADFIDKHTDGGAVFHGAPSLESSLAMARGGMFVSDEEQGVAAFGRGGYTTKAIDFARGYAGRRGVVFRLPVQSGRLNIIEWNQVRDTPFMRALHERCGSLNATFEALARDHGIDIIVNTHVIVQNAAALQFPSDPGELLEGYASVLSNKETPPETLLSVLAVYQSLFAYASALGRKLKHPAEFLGELRDLALSDPRATIGDDINSAGRPADRAVLEVYSRIYAQAAVFEPERVRHLPAPLALQAELLTRRTATAAKHTALDDAAALRAYLVAYRDASEADQKRARAPTTFEDAIAQMTLAQPTPDAIALTYLNIVKEDGEHGGPSARARADKRCTAFVRALVAKAAAAEGPDVGALLKIIDAANAMLTQPVSLVPLSKPLVVAALGSAGQAPPQQMEAWVTRFVELWRSAGPLERRQMPTPTSLLPRLAELARSGRRVWFNDPSRAYRIAYAAAQEAGDVAGAATPEHVQWLALAGRTGPLSSDEAKALTALCAQHVDAHGPLKLAPPTFAELGGVIARLDVARAQILGGDDGNLDDFAASWAGLAQARLRPQPEHGVAAILETALGQLDADISTLAQGKPVGRSLALSVVHLCFALGTDRSAQLRARTLSAMQRLVAIPPQASAALEGRIGAALAAFAPLAEADGTPVAGLGPERLERAAERIIAGHEEHAWWVSSAYADKPSGAIVERLLADPTPSSTGMRALLSALPRSDDRRGWRQELAQLERVGGATEVAALVASLTVCPINDDERRQVRDALGALLTRATTVQLGLLQRCAHLIAAPLWHFATQPGAAAAHASALMLHVPMILLGDHGRDDHSLEHLSRAAFGQLPAPAAGAAERLRSLADQVALERAETVAPLMLVLTDAGADADTRALARMLFDRCKLPPVLQSRYVDLLDDPTLAEPFAAACVRAGRSSPAEVRTRARLLLADAQSSPLKTHLESIARRDV